MEHFDKTLRKSPLCRAIGQIIRSPGMLILGVLAGPGLALAGPTGEQLIHGQAVVSRTDQAHTVIEQHSQRAIIDWQSFNIDLNEAVSFIQPGKDAAMLSRVVGGNPSEILGQLDANGQLFLVNPHGILFGANSQVDVHGLVATTLDINNQDFIDGHHVFSRSEMSPAQGVGVINKGLIDAEAGYIILAGDYARNEGIMQARLGDIGLAAGGQISLDIEGDRLINIAVNEATLAELAGVDNVGQLLADGGRVVMTATVANSLIHTAVNNEGLIQAQGIEERDGEIFLVGHGGDTRHAGVADADNNTGTGGTVTLLSDQKTLLEGEVAITARGQHGGRIDVLGDRVGLLDSAVLDVSGSQGGGDIRVGGDYLGQNQEVPNAQVSFVAEDAMLLANATEQGDGGRIIVWSDHTSRVHGHLQAMGGRQSGDGGFIETSGKHHLTVTRAADASAMNGQAGLWLLDPLNVEINNADVNITVGPDFEPTAGGSMLDAQTIMNALDAGTSVSVSTDVAGGELGDITVNSAISMTGGNDATLTLNATNNIGIYNTISSSAGALDIVLVAGNNIESSDGALISNGGDIVMHAGGNILVSQVNAGTGNVLLLAENDINATIVGADTVAASSVSTDVSLYLEDTMKIGPVTYGALSSPGLLAGGSLNVQSMFDLGILDGSNTRIQAGSGSIILDYGTPMSLTIPVGTILDVVLPDAAGPSLTFDGLLDNLGTLRISGARFDMIHNNLVNQGVIELMDGQHVELVLGIGSTLTLENGSALILGDQTNVSHDIIRWNGGTISGAATASLTPYSTGSGVFLFGGANDTDERIKDGAIALQVQTESAASHLIGKLRLLDGSLEIVDINSSNFYIGDTGAFGELSLEGGDLINGMPIIVTADGRLLLVSQTGENPVFTQELTVLGELQLTAQTGSSVTVDTALGVFLDGGSLIVDGAGDGFIIGELNLQNGAALEVLSGGNLTLTNGLISEVADHTVTINNGGMLDVHSSVDLIDSTLTVAGGGQFNLGGNVTETAGALINSAIMDITGDININAPFTHSGTLTKSGGTLPLGLMQGMTSHGTIDNVNMTLGSPLIMMPGSLLTGDGMLVSGDIDQQGGTISPGGGAVGTITIQGDWQIGNGALVLMHFNGNLHDTIQVGGSAAFLPGALVRVNKLSTTSPTVSPYTLINGTTIGDLPALDGGSTIAGTLSFGSLIFTPTAPPPPPPPPPPPEPTPVPEPTPEPVPEPEPEPTPEPVPEPEPEPLPEPVPEPEPEVDPITLVQQIENQLHAGPVQEEEDQDPLLSLDEENEDEGRSGMYIVLQRGGINGQRLICR